MINVLLTGANGKMGRKIRENAVNYSDSLSIVCGVDANTNSTGDFPIYKDFNNVDKKVDVIIDFSSPMVLDSELQFALKNNTPIVLCSTGLSAEQIEKVNKASEKIAIFRSANMSIGVNVLIDLVKKATASLNGFDVEIIEMHHNEKKDAPSGTALMLADSVKEVDNSKFYTYGRQGVNSKRQQGEIGIHAIRGGNLVGTHEVIFAGNSETITLSHEATDRAIFAVGALKATLYIVNKKNGLYNMSDLINGR